MGTDPSPNQIGTSLPIDPDTPVRPLHLQFSAISLVFAGGIVGTGLRYLVEELFPAHGVAWPWATFGVNLAGAFVLGALLEILVLSGDDAGRRRRLRLCIGTGFCGSLTTYSTFALETAQLGHHGAAGTAVAYAVVSVIAGLVCAWAGIVAAGQAHRRWTGEVS
ncbi:fluoride efflux transporter CrcB [Gordonia desulfuricans]|uniref:Fluoride-specific ion channel FluC n=1 Tax=Gordonia desulfuricans TaxID=89051 RepID=A0A7K3LUY0_9ACTN|nr:fluoride efflux transporter CrcB [Gordonia desulfuricans]NDK92098.1 fluoride efflux transporter CrcB [Gordonia desulfuricans]